MPQIGDLFAKLGQGQTLSVGEIETLRLEMNQFQSAASRLAAIVGPSGGLDSNIFRNSGGFSTLPHEAASLYMGTDQTVLDTTWTTLAGDATSGATWSRGFAIDAPNGLVYVTGVQRETVLFIHAAVDWKADMHGVKVELKWLADDSSIIVDRQYVPASLTADAFHQELDHVRSLPSTQTNYKIQVAQYSGLTQYVSGFWFSVVRLR